MATFFEHFLHFFFPITCEACGCGLPADDYYRVCAACREKIRAISGLYCRRCGIPLPDGGEHCYHCREKKSFHYERLRAAAVYDGIVPGLIYQFKYLHKEYLKRFLGKLLVEALGQYPELLHTDIVIPVPLHWTRKFQRGYNQSALLAAIVAGHINKPFNDSILLKSKFTSPQVGLNREKRLQNLANAFVVRNPAYIKGKTILLIDDVCTTTSTLEQCAATLRRAGSTHVSALVLARD
ncbi:MAG: hypothetical protein A2219_05220 [Elusimicrobia bacterium RIFOXYA2_FULL_50_26]|nr:MAG: hypothetical protein A2219_05220 [Elusimicrobia bacterium RIFOXYA2_FULL_50_26]OGS24070.1 MAG: hypothetical protein A2314_01515 [Elusimicrobia bacterium RIFOXYB2_FULL_50_12]